MSSSGVGTTAVVAAILVPIVSLIKNPKWNDKKKYAVGILAAAISAVIGALIDGNVKTWQQAFSLIFTALGTSQTVYMMYFKDTDMNSKLSEMFNDTSKD